MNDVKMVQVDLSRSPPSLILAQAADLQIRGCIYSRIPLW